MKFFGWNIGRRKFLSMSSVGLAFPIIMDVSRLFAAEGTPAGQGGNPVMGGSIKNWSDDGTKYGKYFISGGSMPPSAEHKDRSVADLDSVPYQTNCTVRAMRFPPGGPCLMADKHVH
jgi:hypothetical protein